MARRRFFNRNQPRDSNGRWTSGGRSKKAKANRNTSAKRKALDRQRAVISGVSGGAGVGYFLAGAPGAAIGAVIGGTKAVRRRRRRR